MKKVAFHTLGCKVNQVETEQLKEKFIQRGYQLVDFNESADLYIVNTCTVTHSSDRKSRAMLRRAARRNPGALVVATGCLAQVDAAQLAAIPGLNLIAGSQQKEDILDLIEGQVISRSESEPLVVCPPLVAEKKLPPVIYSKRHERSRAFVKIQDGCQSYCSYCIVPFARGPSRSKLPEDVAAELQQLVDLGYHEIVLTGIHTGLYGNDLEDWNLSRLLRLLFARVEGDYRIRLSSLEPLEIDEELLEMATGGERLCRHFHIPLQSGSSRILRAMNRRYDRDYYYKLVQDIVQRVKGVAITADVMVGFPGEEKKDYQDTLALLQDLPLLDLHVFKYSKRPGTAAAKMEPQVSDGEKEMRSAELIQLAEAKKRSFINRRLGQELEVLVEQRVGEDSFRSLSDNYLELEFSSPRELIDELTGELVMVKLEAMENSIARGRLLYGSFLIEPYCHDTNQEG